MAKKTNKKEDQFEQVEEALTKTEQYIEDNQKILVRIVGAVIGIIALFIGFQNFIMDPMEEDAQIDMYMAELYFQKDSFSLAVNGDGQYLGFIDVADDYTWTKAGNLANYYAGVSYLYLGEYDNAIEYLEEFDSDDIVLSTLALGCIGDSYMELGDLESALDSYEDASDNSDNEFTKPMYMFKQAMIHELNGNYDDALSLYNDIKKDFKASSQASGIETHISRAENR